MASTSTPAAPAVSNDLTTAGTDTTSSTVYMVLDVAINDTSPGNAALGTQFATIVARHSAAAGTGTLRFVLTDGDTVYDYQDFAIAATAVRDAAAGASGGYVCTVVGSKSLTNVQDLKGATGNRQTSKALYWKYGLTVISSGTISVTLVPSRAI